MVSRFKQWLSPPVFGDDEIKTHRASLINISLIAAFIAGLTLAIGNIISGQIPTLVTLIDLLVAIISVALSFWLRRGHTLSVSIATIAVGLIVITAATAFLGTIRDPTTAIFTLLIAISGLLFDISGITITAILSSIAVLLLFTAENTHLLPVPSQNTTIADWISFCVLFALSGGVNYLGLNITRNALNMADREIIERKKTEQAVRESEKRLWDVIAYNNDGIAVIDDAGFVRLINPAATTLLNRSMEDAIGQPFGLPIDGKQTTEVDLPQGDNRISTVEMRVNTISWMSGQAFLVSLRDITERKRLQEKLRLQATTDSLTGVANRRYFMELAQAEILRMKRLQRPLSIAIIDLDHFKQVNDEHGHAIGDQALKALVSIFQQNIRVIDVFSRFGGDEFILMLPETTSEQAREVINRIQDILASQPLQLEGKSVSITISAGINSMLENDTSLDKLLERADVALYRAKQAGRNRVEI